jgi:hypothetical protein
MGNRGYLQAQPWISINKPRLRLQRGLLIIVINMDKKCDRSGKCDHREHRVQTPKDLVIKKMLARRHHHSLIILGDQTLLGHVHSVEELSDILVLDEARLVNQSS